MHCCLKVGLSYLSNYRLALISMHMHGNTPISDLLTRIAFVH